MSKRVNQGNEEKSSLAQQQKGVAHLKKDNKAKVAVFKAPAISKQIQAIIDAIAGNHWWKDSEGRYLGCSTAVAHALDLGSPNEVIGKTDHELPWSDNADYLVKHDQEVMRLGKTLKREEIVTTKSGEPLTFMVVKAPLRDDEDNIIGTIGTSVDITETKRLQASLKSAKERAEQSDKLKTEFMRNMEHDIRTPFSGIWGMANHLFSQEEDPEKKECLGDITRSAKELLDYCNSILDFSKIEAGTLPVVEKKFMLNQLMRELIDIETPAAKVKKLIIKSKFDSRLPNVIIGDRYRLYRILINLISNAIKFTKKGEINIEFKLAKQLNTREVIIQFIVSDTGIGIPNDKKLYIYEKFSKLNPSNQGIYQGLGLGLRIVKQFSKEIEGEVDVESQKDIGSKFICTIPFKLPLLDDMSIKD